MLPALQKELPCKPEYKTFVPGTKGTRRLQLRNSMQAKFDKILLPIGEFILAPEDHQHLKFDAFFWNVTFHEVAHGLGIKETINGKGSVDAAMGTEKTSWEERTPSPPTSPASSARYVSEPPPPTARPI